MKPTSESNYSSTRKNIPFPQGSHFSRCYSIVDLGTQTEEYLGKPKAPAHKIMIGWEGVNTNEVFDEAKGAQPHVISKDFSFTLGKNKQNVPSNLRKYIDGWRGRAMTDDEAAAGFDLSLLMGKGCQLSIIHKTAQSSGKLRAEIAGIMALPVNGNQPMQIPPLRNEKVYFAIGNADQFDVFKKLYKWVREKISLSPEWAEQCQKIGTTPQALMAQLDAEWKANNQQNNAPAQNPPYQQPQQQQQNAMQPNQNFQQQGQFQNQQQPMQQQQAPKKSLTPNPAPKNPNVVGNSNPSEWNQDDSPF